MDGPHNGPAPGPWMIMVQPKQMFSPSSTKLEVPHTASVKVHCYTVRYRFMFCLLTCMICIVHSKFLVVSEWYSLTGTVYVSWYKQLHIQTLQSTAILSFSNSKTPFSNS